MTHTPVLFLIYGNTPNMLNHFSPKIRLSQVNTSIQVQVVTKKLVIAGQYVNTACNKDVQIKGRFGILTLYH